MASLAFISDIHGNKAALEAVLEDVRERGIETVYCLGDLVGYGPDPGGVIDLVRSAGIPTIAGNYDDGVGWERGDCGCYYPTDEAKRIGEASYAFTAAAVTEERRAFLRQLPRERRVTVGGLTFHLVHGSPRRMNEYLLRDRDERTFLRIAELESADVLVFGHTHDPWYGSYGGVLFVNVGSVGRPKDGDSRAMYSILRIDDGRIEVETVRVVYGVEATARAVVAAGLPPALAQAIREGR